MTSRKTKERKIRAVLKLCSSLVFILLSTALWRCVVFYFEDGGSMLLRNTGTHQPGYVVS
jgi:hypothetical protein